MSQDKTRDEVIEWCIKNRIDFTDPVFPPPEGWMWFDTGVPAKGLTPVFTNNNTDEDDSDIDSFDVLLAVAAARGTGEAMPFVVMSKPKQDEIEASMKAALTADVIDSLKSIDEGDCTEEVYEKIQAAIEDLGG